MPARVAAARRSLAAATLGLLGVLPGCISSEIGPADPDATPIRVSMATLEAGTAAAPGDWTVMRVAGTPTAEVMMTPGRTRAGDDAAYYTAGTARVSAALPEGYPAPTAPGAIELKQYPVVRQAVFSTQRGEGSAFWPLFRHISDRDIAMTAPVVMTGEMAGATEGGASMAFLYRSTDLGPTGPAEENVVVEDTPVMTVIAMGFQGRRGRERLLDMQAALQTWLDQQPAGDRWMADGEPRVLGYNGPDVSVSRRWCEIQVPVRWQPATPAEGPAEPATPAAAAGDGSPDA
jgi:hypothetical protein